MKYYLTWFDLRIGKDVKEEISRDEALKYLKGNYRHPELMLRILEEGKIATLRVATGILEVERDEES